MKTLTATFVFILALPLPPSAGMALQEANLEIARHKIVEFTDDVDLIVNGKTPRGLDCSAEIDVEEEIGGPITFDIYDSARNKLRLISAGQVPSGFEFRDTIVSLRENALDMRIELDSTNLRTRQTLKAYIVLTKTHSDGPVTQIRMKRGRADITCISDDTAMNH